MPNPAGPHWDDGITRWNDGSLWSDGPSAAPELLIPTIPINLSTPTTMEFWAITKQRSQETLPVWVQYLPTLKIGTDGHVELLALIDGFEPLVQARTLAQDFFDGAFRTNQDRLARMKLLGIKVPAIIEGMLSGNVLLMKDVADLYANPARGEAGILKRLRDLLPVWVRANAALAALTPAQPPITREAGGTVYTVALATALLDGYTSDVGTMKTKEQELKVTKADLRKHDEKADKLNKAFYKVARAGTDAGSDLSDALDGITTEPTTPAPETIEINTVTQGGDAGLQVLLDYLAGGGAHATTKLVKWMLVGVDADFVHSAPLDAAGNALGPFVVGDVVRVITEVSNSVATRTSAPRTITIMEPVV